MKKIERSEFRDRVRSKKRGVVKRGGTFDGDVDKKSKRVRHRNSVLCAGAGKHKMLFDSEGAARRFIEYNSDDIERENGHAPRYVYYCDLCMGWHISTYKLPVGYKSDSRKLVEGYMKRNEDKLIYYGKIEDYIVRDISVLEDIYAGKSVVVDECYFELPRELDDDCYRGYIKRYKKMRSVIDGNSDIDVNKLIESYRKFKVHMEGMLKIC